MKFKDFPIHVVDGVEYAQVPNFEPRPRHYYCCRYCVNEPQTASFCGRFVSKCGTTCASVGEHGPFVTRDTFQKWLVDYVANRIGSPNEY